MISKKIAEYINDMDFNCLPRSVVEKVRWILLDTIGCAVSGVSTPIGKSVIDCVTQLGGRETSTIIGSNLKTNCLLAGYTNAILSDALDYEETSLCHPSATIVPAALAVGEMRDSSAKEVLLAIVIGYEIGERIGMAVYPSPVVRKERAVPFGYLAFGANASTSKLLGLKKSEIISSIGYAGSSTPLPTSIVKWERPLSWLKNNFGEQAAAGIMASMLAKNGFLAPMTMLESTLGFGHMIGSDRCDFDEAFSSLGTEYIILKDAFKPYPACRWLHSALDAVRELRKQHEFHSKDIKRIDVYSFSELANWFKDYNPQHLVDAEFSLPYTVALVAIGVPPGPEWYSQSMIRNPEVLILASKVNCIIDQESERKFFDSDLKSANVEIFLMNGQKISKRVDHPRGSLDNPMSENELLYKFKTLTFKSIDEHRLDEAIRLWEDLEEISSIRSFTRLFMSINGNL
jgi:2-methylcitrate dehydratase PrpD